MSSFDRRTFLTLTAALAGCGFTPVYGPGGAGHELQNAVLVDDPGDRNAYQLVRRIEERLGRATAARYGLSIALSVSEESMAVTADGKTTRFDLVGKATYALRALDSGAVLRTGSVDSFTGYSTTGTTVATLAAERDARERLMTILADQIVTRLFAEAASLAP